MRCQIAPANWEGAMSDKKEADAGGEEDVDVPEAGGEDGQPKRRLSTKKLILYIGAPLLLIIIGGTAAFFLVDFSGGYKPSQEAKKGEEPAKPPAQVAFFDLPEMLVNLNTGSKQASYLKIKISLELADAATQPQIQAMMPRVLDSFQTYLRELRHEDLRADPERC